MAILFGEPVDQYNANSYFTDLWTQFGWFSNNDSTKPTVNQTGSRRGGHCLQFLPVANGCQPLMVTLNPSGNTAIALLAFKGIPGAINNGWQSLVTPAAGGNSLNVVAANAGTGDNVVNQIFSVRKDYYTQVAFSVNANGTISAYQGTATPKSGAIVGVDRISATYNTTNRAILFNQWNVLAIKVLSHASGGTIDLYVNGDPWMTLSAQDTIAPDGSAGWNNLLIGLPRCQTVTGFQYHDILFLDTNTSDQDNDLADLILDATVMAQFPTADGAMRDFTPSSGADHFEMVNEMPPDDDLTYNGSNTVGHIDSFITPGVPIANATILAVGAMINAKRQNSGPSATQVGFRIGGTNYTIGSALGNTSDYSYQQAFVNKKPSDHAAWSNADYAASQPLYEKTA